MLFLVPFNLWFFVNFLHITTKSQSVTDGFDVLKFVGSLIQFPTLSYYSYEDLRSKYSIDQDEKKKTKNISFAIWLNELKPGLCDNLEEWDGEGGGREVQEAGGICVFNGWYMLMYNRNQHSIIKQLSLNQKKIHK